MTRALALSDRLRQLLIAPEGSGPGRGTGVGDLSTALGGLSNPLALLPGRVGRRRRGGGVGLPASALAREGAGEAKNLIIVVRADPIICGHSTEARNLAEAAKASGFDRVHLVSYPMATLASSGLPLKPADAVSAYSPGIEVERPEPIGGYKVLDGRLMHAMSGRVIDLLHQCQGRTLVMCLYLVPHGEVVMNAVQSFWHAGRSLDVTTIAEAVGSDITDVVSNALRDGQLGAAQMVLTNYLMHDRPVAVSDYTRGLIIEAGAAVDERLGTNFAGRLERRVGVSYPAINTSAYVTLKDRPDEVNAVLARRGLAADGYLLFLSRVAPAKGVDDLITAYRQCPQYSRKRLVVCGTGPAQADMVKLAAGDPNITFFDDVSDEEKGPLMHGCHAYVFPSKPRPEFVETFGIAVAEAMLSGGGPVVTTRTGGIPEATGGHCLEHEADDVGSLIEQLERLDAMSPAQRQALSASGQAYAMRFDRAAVLAGLCRTAEMAGAR